MRYFLILSLLSCAPDKPVDSTYFRHCRIKCLRDGHQRARVVETELKYTCECAGAPEPEKT